MSMKFVRYGTLRTSPSPVAYGARLYEVQTAMAGQTSVSLTGTYEMGVNELQVYLNGVRQILGVDYQETDPSGISFLEALEAGDSLLFRVEEVRMTRMHEEFVAGAGQVLFTLSSSYRLGAETLQVYHNGILMRKDDDYIEVDKNTVRFNFALSAGHKVTFHETV